MNINRKGTFQDLNALFVFGACTVLLIHILGFFIAEQESYPWNAELEAISLILLRFGRFLFIFATGMLLFYWYKHKPMDWLAFWRKRWHVIILPYAIWTGIYTVCKLQTFDPVVLLPQFLKSLVTGSSFYHLYYIPLYLQLNLLFFLCKRLVERYLRFPFVVAFFCLQAILYFAYSTLFVDPSRPAIDWSAHWLLQWAKHFFVFAQNYPYMYLFYFFLGAYAGLHVDKWRYWTYRLRYLSMAIATLAALWFTVRYLNGTASYEESLNIFHPLYLLYTTSFLAACYPVSAWLGKIPVLSRWLAALAKQNMAIYIVHPLILFLLESYVIFRLNWSTPALIVAMFLVTPPLCIFLYEHVSIRFWTRRGKPKRHKRRPLVTHGA